MGTGANGFAGPGGPYQGMFRGLEFEQDPHRRLDRPIRRRVGATSTASGIRSAEYNDGTSATDGHARVSTDARRSIRRSDTAATSRRDGLRNADAPAAACWVPRRPADGVSARVWDADGYADGDDGRSGNATAASDDGSQRFTDAPEIVDRGEATARENALQQEAIYSLVDQCCRVKESAAHDQTIHCIQTLC